MLRKSLTLTVRAVVLGSLCSALLASPLSIFALNGPAVALAWDPSTDTTVTGYNVYYGTESHTYTNVIAAGTATNAVVSNLVSGVIYYFAATTYTAAGLESDYSAEASYAVPAQNIPPTISPLPDLTIPQNSVEQLVQMTGITSGSTNEVQTLSVNAFSSNPGLIPNPVVTYNSPDSTGTLAFTPLPGSFGQTVITVLVDDGGAVSNTVIASFTVTVAPTENPPTIDTPANLVINENAGVQTVNLSGITAGSTNSSQALMVTAVSSNPGLIPNPAVNYATPSTTGSLSFAPVTNASGTAIITVIVSDTQAINNTISTTFNVTVNQTVLPPGVLTNAIIAPNTTLSFVIPTPATNGDKFNMSLGAGAPAGVKITTRKGVSRLIWTPTMSQASTTNLISFQITDTSNSALSTNESVIVIVQDYVAVDLGMTSLQAGQSGKIALALSSSDGVTNLSFTLPWPANALLNPALTISATGVASSSLKAQSTNLLISLQMSSGQVLTGSNVIGSISFQSAASQPSGYLNLPIVSLLAYKPSGVPYGNWFPKAGQVAVINSVAMLQAAAPVANTRSLTILGKIGVSYQVQYCTNFGPSALWYSLATYSQTNTSQTISVDPSLPFVFYRVQQK